jgi:hypothetical protein
MMPFCKPLLALLLLSTAMAFAPVAGPSTLSTTHLSVGFSEGDNEASASRRTFLNTLTASSVAAATFGALPAWSEKYDLEGFLYKVVRVREATQQERRLIKSGKFKDIQRANVKLAVKFMIQNYQLSDNIVAASAYLPGGSQMKAIDVGQSAVQNLQTILEYFDSSDVQNIKVSLGIANDFRQSVTRIVTEQSV